MSSVPGLNPRQGNTRIARREAASAANLIDQTEGNTKRVRGGAVFLCRFDEWVRAQFFRAGDLATMDTQQAVRGPPAPPLFRFCLSVPPPFGAPRTRSSPSPTLISARSLANKALEGDGTHGPPSSAPTELCDASRVAPTLALGRPVGVDFTHGTERAHRPRSAHPCGQACC